MSSTPINGECSICDMPLRRNEEMVTTECDHTFHRSCAQKRLDERHKGNCRTCGKQSVLTNALQKHQRKKTTTPKDSYDNQHQDKRKKDSAKVPITTNQNDDIDDEENIWQCINCTMKNSKLMKICEVCDEPQHAAATSRKDICDQNSQSAEKKIDYYHSRDEENNWQCIGCKMENTKSMKKCGTCGVPRRALATSLKHNYDQNSQLGEEKIAYYQSHNEANNWQCLNCTMINTISTKMCEVCGEPQHAEATSLRDTYNQDSQSDEEKTDYYNSRDEAKAKVETNGQKIQNVNSEQVKQRVRDIKFSQPFKLLVADSATYNHHKQQGKLIHSGPPDVRKMPQKKSNRTRSRTLSLTRDPQQPSSNNEDVDEHYTRPSSAAKSANVSIDICKGDLITQRTDVIVVCSSSQDLFNSICKAGGGSMSASYHAELAKNPKAPVVAVKAAGELASKRVYFLPWTVNSDTSVLCRSLQKFISDAIRKAVKKKYRSIAFPAIGCGQYGCSIDLVAQTLVEEAYRQSRMDGISVSFVIQPERKDIYNEFRKQLNLLQSADKVESTSVAVGKGIIEVEKGDITMQKMDVIVGSSSSEILRKTIINAAGNEIQIAYDTEYKHNPNSVLIVTPPGVLLCKRIFFIKWKPDADEEILRQSLVDLIWNVIQNAMTHKFTSIAFPAIGCGKHGCSIDVVVQTMVKEMKEQLMKRNLPWIVKFVVQPDQQNIYDEFCKHLLTTPQDGSREAKVYQVPSKWETSTEDKRRFVLSTTSDEYKSIFTKFNQAMTGKYTQIIRIERIQNERWYIQYLAHSEDFEKRLKIDTEKCLYHGCPEQAANSIIEDGFNRSFAGKNGVVYGFGVYFSSNATYSHGFAKPNKNGEHFMFVARVLIGKATAGNESMTTRPVGFDSTTGLDHIFVTYHDAQAFAEYLISYK